MSKRLPEELEAPDLKMARERKERRAMEARGVVLNEGIQVGRVVPAYIEPESIEDLAEEIEQKADEIIKKDIKQKKLKKLFKRR